MPRLRATRRALGGQVTIPLGLYSVLVTLTAALDHVMEKKDNMTMTLVPGIGYQCQNQQPEERDSEVYRHALKAAPAL